MNHLKFLLLFLVGIFMGSCEQETFKESTTQADLQFNTEASILNSNERSVTDPVVFENHLQWLSFTTSYLLKHDVGCRTLMLSKLDANNTVQLDDLDDINPVYNFKFKLRERLIYYFGTDPEPDTEHEKPPTPPLPPFNPPTPEEIADMIVDYVFDENCVEFYFPNGITFGWNFSVTSTAHPMTTAASNNGIIRTYQPYYNEEGLLITTSPTTVDDTYLLSNTLVIVGRPYKVPPTKYSTHCSYPEYSDIDFTYFLD